ncbi:MAG: hypothetical protein M5U25_21130 [Planctomycetota bacterium]|nr:hypothetical protein [Planctomycetota bacterium]
MATEDVTIRIRVDDSELRRARARAAVTPAISAPISPNQAIAAGLAGSVFGVDVGSKLSEMRQRALALNERTKLALELAGRLGVPTTSERLAVQTARGSIARQLSEYDRSADYGGVGKRYFTYGEDGFSIEKTISVGEHQLVLFKERNYDLDFLGDKARIAAHASKGNPSDFFGHLIGSRFNVQGNKNLVSAIEEDILKEPIQPTRVGGIFGPTAPKYKKPGLVRGTLEDIGVSARSTLSSLKFPKPEIDFSWATAKKDFKTSALPLLRQAAPWATAAGIGALATSFNQARSSYMNKVLVAGDVPDSNYVVDFVSIEAAKSAGRMLGKIGLLPLELGMGLISLYNTAWESMFGDGANPNNRRWMDWEINVDSTRQLLRDAVGANDTAYAEVERQQDLYYKAMNRAQNAAREEAKRIGADIGQRLMDLGLNNMTLDQLAEKFKNYGGIEEQLLARATREFKASNVLPTKRDVNPYWTGDVHGGVWETIFRVFE